jgi:hypothetical protein
MDRGGKGVGAGPREGAGGLGSLRNSDHARACLGAGAEGVVAK